MPVCTIRTLCPVFHHPQLSTDSAISRGVCGSEIESQQKIPTKRDDADLLLIGSDFAPFFQLGNGLAGEIQGVSFAIDHDLHFVRVIMLLAGVDIPIRLAPEWSHPPSSERSPGSASRGSASARHLGS